MLASIAALALAQANALPITEVTVFSDRARVTRAGPLAVAGRQRLELATLLDSVDTTTINVEVSGAELETIELLPLEDEQLPVGEARALLKQLDENGDALTKLTGELNAVRAAISSIGALTPQVPQGTATLPPPRLSSAGWSAAVSFSGDQLARLQARDRDLTVKQTTLTEKRAELQAKATLLGGAQRRSGWKVVAIVKGQGPAKFAVTYVALNARWYPTYDVQLVPDTGKVQVSFAGLVAQETGEDWSDTSLILSTAVPSQATEFVKPLTWKIGTKERFIPTPTPVMEMVAPPPPALAREGKRGEADDLRLALRSQLADLGGKDAAKELEQRGDFAAAERERRKSQDEDRRKQRSLQSLSGKADAQKKAEPNKAEQRPPPPPAVMAVPAPQRAPAEPHAGALMYDSSSRDEISVVAAGAESSVRRAGPVYRYTEMSLQPPPAYARPSFAPHLPAAAGGGYDLAWPSLQRESVLSGKGERRVALFTQTWPVTTERKLYPALFTESFLVAELKSPAPWPLPAGGAHLYVGADPAGTAQLKLVSPGETFTLPLGIDRALRPVRNVKVVDAEKGVFSKDDVSEYTVSIQLANPYRAPVAVRIYDQIPVTDDKEVEVKLIETRPDAKKDTLHGHLEWRLNVPAGQKTEVTYRYTLKRPKGWKMNQWEVTP